MCGNTYVIQENNMGFGVSLLHLHVSAFQQNSTLVTCTNMQFTLRTHDGVEATVATGSMESLTIVSECRIRQFFLKQ